MWNIVIYCTAKLEAALGANRLWRTVNWLVLCLCVMSSTAAAFLGFIGLRSGRRFTLMTAMGFSCCLSFWYRIYLLSATLSNRYSTTFASPLVHAIMIGSGTATTVFYTCLASTTLHTFIAITLHPSQYDPIAASQMYVHVALVMGAVSTVIKWTMASIISSNYDKSLSDTDKSGPSSPSFGGGLMARLLVSRMDELQPSPMNADGTPWVPKARLAWWEFTPLRAKPHSIVNLFLLLVIGAACPVFLSYVLSKMLRIRREAKVTLGPAARCSIKRSHIYRLVATLVSMVIFSFTSIATMVIDETLRGHRHLNLLVQPTLRDLALRYFCSAGTGLVLFTIYITGDELRQTILEFLKHAARKDRRQPCRCRRCVTGESDYNLSLKGIDPITTLPIQRSDSNAANHYSEERREGDDDGVIDFFSALRETGRPHARPFMGAEQLRSMSITSNDEVKPPSEYGSQQPTPSPPRTPPHNHHHSRHNYHHHVFKCPPTPESLV